MFESLISLEPCCIILKELIMPDHLLEENSIERGLIRSYEGVYQTGKLYIQASEHQKWQQPHMNLRHDFRLAYIQLWLFCLRYFPYLGRIVPRIEPNKKRREKIEYEQSPRYWQMLGSLALDIGFFNERIRKFSEQDVVDKLTKSFLLAVRPDHTHPPEKINRIKEMVIYQTSKPLQVVSGLLPELTLKRRIGRLFDRDFEHGKSGFFLPNILGKLECERGSITILHAYENLFSSFFRLKDLPVCSLITKLLI